jgi:hypothetical protein
MKPWLLVAGGLFVGFLMGYNYRATRAQVADVPVQTAAQPPAPGAPRLTIPPGQSVIGFLDAVDGKTGITAAAGSEVKVSGWAGCASVQSPLSKVEIVVDDRAVAEATLAAVARPDVATAYGRPDFEHSGWRASFVAQGLKPGAHRLSARGTCADGGTGVLPPFHLTVN